MLRKLFFSRHEYRSFDHYQSIINSKFALRSSYSSSIHQFHDSTLPRPRTQPCAIGLENEPRVGILICQNVHACSCFTFFMFVASSGLYSFNTYYYVCSLIQPASLFIHLLHEFLGLFFDHHYYQFIHCLDVIIEPLLYISVLHIAFQLMYIHLTIQRHAIFRVPTVGFDPPQEREDCYQSTTLPPSHHGWIFKVWSRRILKAPPANPRT